MTNNEYVKEQREGAQSSSSSGLLFPRSSTLWAHVPLKSHADVIYVFKLDASTAHPPPRIFACEDCTAPPVRRWREEMWGGDCWEEVGLWRSSMSLKEIHIHQFVLRSLQDTTNHRVQNTSCASARCIDQRNVFVYTISAASCTHKERHCIFNEQSQM